MDDVMITILHLGSTAWMIFYFYVMGVFLRHPIWKVRDIQFPFWVITTLALITLVATFSDFWANWSLK